MPCIGEIFCSHIREALDVIPAELQPSFVS
jgi:hypothetical protein